MNVISVKQVNDKCVAAKITGKNGFGGSVTEEYLIFTDDAYTKSGILIATKYTTVTSDELAKAMAKKETLALAEFQDFLREKPTKTIKYRVDKINEYLNNEKKSNGWI